MSPTPRDYRDYPNPRLFSYEILIELIKRKINEFTSTEVADLFKIKPAEACTRITVLKRYGCVKVILPKTYPAVYQITNWGVKYAKKKERDGK